MLQIFLDYLTIFICAIERFLFPTCVNQSNIIIDVCWIFQQFFPAHMLDTKGSADVNAYDGTGDRARNLLLQVIIDVITIIACYKVFFVEQ
jgi:hypothetical protein